MINIRYLSKNPTLLFCNEQQGFKPLPVGEFRWYFKHLSDQVRKNTSRLFNKMTRLFTDITQIKNTLFGCFFIYKPNKK